MTRPALAVTLLALTVRLAWLAFPFSNVGDSLEYLRLAENINVSGRYSEDGVTPSSYRPPFYPAAIAALDRVTGHRIVLTLVLQCVLGALTVALLFQLTETAFGRSAAVVAALGLALAPTTSRFAAVLMTETLFTFFVVLAVWLWTRGRPAAAGLAIGVATLTRASTLPFVALMAAVAMLPLSRVPRKQLAVAVSAALLVLAPWAVRNRIQVGHWTIADAGFGVNLLYGSIDLHRGSNRWDQLAAATGASASDDEKAAHTVVAEDRARRRAFDRIRAQPLRWIRTRARQIPWLFLDTGEYLPLSANQTAFDQAVRERRLSTLALKIGFLLGNGVMVALALAGVWLSRHRLVALTPLWIFPAFLIAAHVPMYVEPRYGLPLVPFLLMFAAHAVVTTMAG